MRGTHELESAEGETSEDSERKQASEGHSLSGERRGKDKSELQNKDSKSHSLSGERGGRDTSRHRKKVSQ